MNDIDIQIEWQEGSGESLEIGYLNPNCQQCCGHCGVPGTDQGRSTGDQVLEDSQQVSA